MKDQPGHPRPQTLLRAFRPVSEPQRSAREELEAALGEIFERSQADRMPGRQRRKHLGRDDAAGQTRRRYHQRRFRTAKPGFFQNRSAFLAPVVRCSGTIRRAVRRHRVRAR